MSVYTGIPYGPAGMWSPNGTLLWGPGPFTSSTNPTTPSGIIRHINAARVMNQKLILHMTGGSHERYKTDGKFDLAKWKAVMNTFDKPEIKAAVAEGVADGTVIMNNVMDEPNIADWGGVMTKPLLDEMAAYVDAMFPTLPIGVTHRHDWRLEERYRVMDALFAQFGWRKGTVTTYRDSVLAVARRDDMAVVFSLNILNGGIMNRQTKACPIPLTGGYGTRVPACRMTADQVRDWGRILGSAGCAMSMWQYDPDFMANPANLQAFEDVAGTLSTIPGRPCRRSAAPPAPPANIPPTAAFEAPRCRAGVACQFNDASSDDDGSIATRSWEFGNGETSTERNPSTTFAETGGYNVTLTVTDDAGASSSLAKSVTVSSATNTPPTAVFEAPSCTAGKPCQFHDASGDDDGNVTGRQWDFGNGETATGADPSTTFNETRDYDVTLTVTDNDAATNSVTKSVTVSPWTNAPPTAAFDAPSCTAGVACQFNDASSDEDGSIATRSWEFGNGETSTATSPSTTFDTEGDYSVILTVTDNDGAESSVAKSVTVASAPTPTSITLSLTGFVKDGRQYVTLTWSGATGSTGDLYRDGVLILNTANDGRQNTLVPYQGKADYTYQVCETGTSRCSAAVTFAMPSILLNVKAWMKEVDLQAMTHHWAGANGETVNVYRNGVLTRNTANDGSYTSTRRFQGVATYLLKVCETATSKCSNTVTATFE